MSESGTDGRTIDWPALRRQLMAVLGRICPPWLAERREDLVQAALLKVMEIEQRREGETLWTAFYLGRVAHSALVDEIRRRRRRPEEPLEETAEAAAPAAETADPERGTLGRELGRGLRDCLAALVEARRRACTLHLLGHGTSEVARLLGWEAKKAENAIYRGLADLRLCLEKKGLAP
jgi:RNA polymerase sigma-70 factor, ECF subfamily